MTIGVGVAAAPLKFWATQIFWAAKRNLGKASFNDVFKLFLIDRYFLFLPEVSIVTPVKSTRDSGYVARDEPLIISKGDHKLINISLFFF